MTNLFLANVKEIIDMSNKSNEQKYILIEKAFTEEMAEI